MQILELLGICFGAFLALLLAIFLRRRLLMAGGGTIRVQVRVSTMVPGRGWSSGIGQFVGDELRFHRMFSFAVRPKRVLDRRGLTVDDRRLPEGPERLAMPGDWVILTCTTDGCRVEIAMAESTVTGFLSWLEAGPPGRRLHPHRSAGGSETSSTS
ncbi:DUF2550 domain-containing protein [Jidongwangia harbinensis]|uniref:DUF2550 domain-containing protein n=1 Tax=Jidongwangia harbinensis TaxID=2878561 RepID=UPI001CD9CAC0|nr:DUF2550 domain-containing protein [Jidongwangia harbinensis]MCA2213560.1 DUF2550 domain-containing protein [Jidongwangia harbinensis]